MATPAERGPARRTRQARPAKPPPGRPRRRRRGGGGAAAAARGPTADAAASAATGDPSRRNVTARESAWLMTRLRGGGAHYARVAGAPGGDHPYADRVAAGLFTTSADHMAVVWKHDGSACYGALRRGGGRRTTAVAHVPAALATPAGAAAAPAAAAAAPASGEAAGRRRPPAVAAGSLRRHGRARRRWAFPQRPLRRGTRQQPRRSSHASVDAFIALRALETPELTGPAGAGLASRRRPTVQPTTERSREVWLRTRSNLDGKLLLHARRRAPRGGGRGTPGGRPRAAGCRPRSLPAPAPEPRAIPPHRAPRLLRRHGEDGRRPARATRRAPPPPRASPSPPTTPPSRPPSTKSRRRRRRRRRPSRRSLRQEAAPARRRPRGRQPPSHAPREGAAGRRSPRAARRTTQSAPARPTRRVAGVPRRRRPRRPRAPHQPHQQAALPRSRSRRTRAGLDNLLAAARRRAEGLPRRCVRAEVRASIHGRRVPFPSAQANFAFHAARSCGPDTRVESARDRRERPLRVRFTETLRDTLKSIFLNVVYAFFVFARDIPLPRLSGSLPQRARPSKAVGRSGGARGRAQPPPPSATAVSRHLPASGARGNGQGGGGRSPPRWPPHGARRRFTKTTPST